MKFCTLEPFVYIGKMSHMNCSCFISSYLLSQTKIGYLKNNKNNLLRLDYPFFAWMNEQLY